MIPAEQRIRLYLALNKDISDISEEMVSDPRFQGEGWAHTMYAVPRTDVEAVLAQMDWFREVRDGMAKTLLDVDSANSKLLHKLEELREATEKERTEALVDKAEIGSLRKLLATRDRQYQQLEMMFENLQKES